MKLNECLEGAIDEALKHSMQMVVCEDPIGNVEDDSAGRGPFGYCPFGAEELLFKYGKIVAIIRPNSTRGTVSTEWITS